MTHIHFANAHVASWTLHKPIGIYMGNLLSSYMFLLLFAVVGKGLNKQGS